MLLLQFNILTVELDFILFKIFLREVFYSTHIWYDNYQLNLCPPAKAPIIAPQWKWTQGKDKRKETHRKYENNDKHMKIVHHITEVKIAQTHMIILLLLMSVVPNLTTMMWCVNKIFVYEFTVMPSHFNEWTNEHINKSELRAVPTPTNKYDTLFCSIQAYAQPIRNIKIRYSILLISFRSINVWEANEREKNWMSKRERESLASWDG